MSSAVAIGVSAAGVAISAAGTGISMYGASQSAAAQRSAAASNAYISKMAAQAEAQAAVYANELNYRAAMAQSQEQANNATILHHYAGSLEQQGNESIARLSANQSAQNSQMQAAYGASGITSDSGSPLQVAAYKAGNDQLARMDSQYKVNLQALDSDFQGTMQTYQSQLTAATAQQYKYAEQMAQWKGQAGIVGADVQQSNANAAANAGMISAYGSATAQIGSALSSGISNYRMMGGQLGGTGNFWN